MNTLRAQVAPQISDLCNIRHFDVRIQGLPEGDFEELSKNADSHSETEFPALLNGTNIIELR